MKNKSQLKNWLIHKSETGHYHLYGEIFNDDRFTEGCTINTSRIIKIEQGLCADFYVTTRNTTYYIKVCEAYDNGIYNIYDVMNIVNGVNKE